MGIKTTRQKPKQPLFSIIYRTQKILPFSKKRKFKLFLNLEWIFNRLAHETSFAVYTPDEHPVRQFSKAFILDHIKETDTVLDLGCNLGDISFMVAEKAREVVGIDHNKKAIEFAKQKYKRPNLIFYDVEAHEFLQKNSASFDVLILSHILEHLDDPKEFLLAFSKFFKYIYIEVPDFDRYYLNQYRKDHHLNLIYSDNDHISEFDRDELRDLVTACGIEIQEEEYRFGVQKIWCKVKPGRI